ncbi:MAG TPA: hypothetical protein VHM01_14805 [Alphaproteobacteria bacterium]|nr:hypothetical protein [Alphaproteobacteria bacterium]
MIACHVRGWGVAALLLVTAGASAVAQTPGPIRLAPPRIVVQEPAAGQTVPATETQPAEAPRTETKPEIIVSDTPALNLDGIGLIDESRGGLPETVWKGSTRPVIDRLLTLLPAPTTSPAARSLAERLLTTTATPPAPGPDKPATSFVVLRAERLMALGRSASAAGLARAVPQREENEALSRVLLDAALLEYDNAGACQIVRRQIGKANTPYWQKALIFCQALAGEHDRAELGVSLMREQRADDDPLFVRLVNALLGDNRPIADVVKPTPLHLAMLRAARQQIPASAAESADAGVLRMIAQSPNTTLETRLAAADQAEAFGALSPEALIQIFEAVPFTADELSNAAPVVAKAPRARAHAALYRAIKAQAVGAARAETLTGGLDAARARGFHVAAARTLLPLVRELTPTPELAPHAAAAGRILLLNGYRDDARRWYEAARAAAASGTATNQSDVLLWPLLRLAGVDVPAPDVKALAAWRAAQEKLDAERMPARTAVLTALLEGLGDATDGSLASLLLSGNLAPQPITLPHPALWLGRDGAASAGRVGEAALFVLDSMGPDGTASVPPQTLIALVQALRAVGLETDARALALEAAISAGL